MKSEGLYASQGGPIILSQVPSRDAPREFRLTYFLPLYFISLTSGKCWLYRLRMNTKTLKRRFMRKEPPMFVGQLKWRWSSVRVYHGWCASKLMLLIQLWVFFEFSNFFFPFSLRLPTYIYIYIYHRPYSASFLNKTLQINTCNGMRCGETFSGPNSPNKPSLWTENWTSLYAFSCSLSFI